MKNKFVKIGSVILVLVMSISVICSCDNKKDEKKETAASVENAPSLDDLGPIIETLEVDNGTFAPVEATGMENVDVESVWNELCEGMTPEEIASCEQDFADIGWSKEDIVALLYQYQ